jgi:tellurite resistance protein TerB
MLLAVGQNKSIKSKAISVTFEDLNESSSLLKAYAFIKSADITKAVVCAGLEKNSGITYTPKNGTFHLNISSFPADVTKISFALSIDHNQLNNFGNTIAPIISIFDSEKIQFQLSQDGRTEKAIILLDVYLHKGSWKVKALAGGFVGGLNDLLKSMSFTIPEARNTSAQKQSIQMNKSSQNLPVNSTVQAERNASNNERSVEQNVHQNSQSSDLTTQGIKNMFSKLFKRGEQAAADLKSGVLKFKSKSFLEASIAGSFMVSAADGSIDSEEKKKLLIFVQSDDALSVFDAADVAKIFKEYESAYDFDADAGKAKALKAIAKIAGNQEQSKFLIRMIVAIGAADGDFDNDEKAVVRTICKELGLNPADFDL